MASTSASADYHAIFQADKRAIISLFEQTPPNPLDIAPRLQSLRSGLNDNIAFLPAYDRRSYDIQLKELESKLSQLRSKDKPKSRFAFSSSKAKAGPSSTSASTIPPTPPIKVESVIASICSLKSTPIHLIQNQSNKLLRVPSDIEGGYTISLESLESCIIDLRPNSPSTEVKSSAAIATSLHAKSLRRCVIIGPVMEGSAIMEGLEDCLVVIGAQQFRIHSSKRTNILLHVPSTPIIEHSSELKFGPYPPFLNSPGYASKHDQVQDFDWIREGNSPNWSLVEDRPGGKHEILTEQDAGAIAQLVETDIDGLRKTLERLIPIQVVLQPDAS